MATEPKRGSKIRTWAKALPNGGKEGYVYIVGFRRMGKTALAWEKAEEAHERGQDVVAFQFPPKGQHLLPRWVKFVDSVAGLAKLRRNTVVVADEMATRANARESMSDENRAWGALVAICGQRHLMLWGISQHNRQIDVALVIDPDIIIFKKPSQLHIRFSRPELRPEVEEAYEVISKARGDKRKWCLVVDYHSGRRGLLINGLPSFWTEELSEAYGKYELARILAKKAGEPQQESEGVRQFKKAVRRTKRAKVAQTEKGEA